MNDDIHSCVCSLKNDLIHSIYAIAFSSLTENYWSRKESRMFNLLISVKSCFLEKGVDNG